MAEGKNMTAKDLTDDELIARITETYNLTRYGGDVAELVRRYRDSSFRLSRIANEASFQSPSATQVAPAPEKPVATSFSATSEGRGPEPAPSDHRGPYHHGLGQREDCDKCDAWLADCDVPGCTSCLRTRASVAPAPEKPVATPPRGGTGHAPQRQQCGCGAPLDSTGRCTWGPSPRCRLPRTAAGVIELCQRVLEPPARYEDVHTLAEWVLTTGLVGRLCPCGSPLDEQGRCPVHTRLMRDVTGKT
jgi:hypothetical protein